MFYVTFARPKRTLKTVLCAAIICLLAVFLLTGMLSSLNSGEQTAGKEETEGAYPGEPMRVEALASAAGDTLSAWDAILIRYSIY